MKFSGGGRIGEFGRGGRCWSQKKNSRFEISRDCQLCNLVVQEVASLKRFVKGRISHIHCIYQYILPYNSHIYFHATLTATLRHVVQNHWTVILQ